MLHLPLVLPSGRGLPSVPTNTKRSFPYVFFKTVATRVRMVGYVCRPWPLGIHLSDPFGFVRYISVSPTPVKWVGNGKGSVMASENAVSSEANWKTGWRTQQRVYPETDLVLVEHLECR